MLTNTVCGLPNSSGLAALSSAQLRMVCSQQNADETVDAWTSYKCARDSMTIDCWYGVAFVNVEQKGAR